MSSFSEIWAAQRRLFMLRFLVEADGQANEAVITSVVRRGGFGQASREDIGADLDFLARNGATTEDWFGAVRVVKVTGRGEDIAHGRVTVDGIEHSIWRRDR